MKANVRLVQAAGAALGMVVWLAAEAFAQPPSTTRRTATPLISNAANTAALPVDLIAIYQPPPTIVESYSTDHPCTSHSHTHTAFVKFRRLPGAPVPSNTATLYRDGQPVATWQLTGPTGSSNQPIVLGWFTWTKPHPCPGGGTSVTVLPEPVKNYRLVIDPSNQLAEASEANNTVEFHIDPSVPLVKAP